MASRDEKLRRRSLAQAAQEQAEARRRPIFETRLGKDPWSECLHELDHIVVSFLRKYEERVKRFHKVFPEAKCLLERGTMLREPACLQAVTTAERALGVPLPVSYRQFLAASNGLVLPRYCQFVPVQELVPYARADPEGLEVLLSSWEDVPEPSDEEYKRAYEDPKSDSPIRAGHAASSIALNGPVPLGRVETKEFGWILLVPQEQTGPEECEIWEHGSWHNRRYLTFESYFTAARAHVAESLEWIAS